jgi:PAS domain-containing protein
MTETAAPVTAAFEALRRDKAVFDNTWTLATLFAATLAVLCWYFRLTQVDIAPVIWVLAGLTFLQVAFALVSRRAISAERLRGWALGGQLLGTVLLAIGWHLFGGLQQPLFPLFILLPLLPGAAVLGFWQQQVALATLLGVLLSGVLLSPDTNSYIADRYGISHAAHALPAWLPRSRVAFADVTTSPAYDLMLVATVAVLSIAASAVARSLASALRRGTGQIGSLQEELTRLEHLNVQLVARAPSAQVLLESDNGRIVRASARFRHAFGVEDIDGKFLLDALQFDYPAVVRQLIASGGEEILGATLQGREVVLRVRAEMLDFGAARLTALELENSPEIWLRGEVDALDEPMFAVTAAGRVVLPNRSAVELLGQEAEQLDATDIFPDPGRRWWDIAPLDSARRIHQRGAQRYLVSIRRLRVVASVGELAFIRLQPVAPA